LNKNPKGKWKHTRETTMKQKGKQKGKVLATESKKETHKPKGKHM
jgi:hypothetical protein